MKSLYFTCTAGNLINTFQILEYLDSKFNLKSILKWSVLWAIQQKVYHKSVVKRTRRRLALQTLHYV